MLLHRQQRTEDWRQRPLTAPDRPLSIEDYALLGDGRSAALVGKTGSIDWLCWPRFDSPACFAALLGTPSHGRWWIGPTVPVRRVSRAYRPGTAILETVFDTDAGSVATIDFMPYGGASVVRIVESRSGAVPMGLELALRFDNGQVAPNIETASDGRGAILRAGADTVTLCASVAIQTEATNIVAAFRSDTATPVCFVLTHASLGRPAPDPLQALTETEAFWRGWSERCTYRGPWRDAVLRSLATLKTLCHSETGGIVAAPTTSLPEHIGGERNWDYRYCWPRDSALTVRALLRSGHTAEAAAWIGWLRRALGGRPPRPLYSLDGGQPPAEHVAAGLPGYRASSPVRIGNAAAEQAQLDVYGETIGALHCAIACGAATPAETWDLQIALVAHLETIWRDPDEGIWEIRGGPRQFVFSKAMAWFAVDCALRNARAFDLPAPLARWQALAAAIHADICANGLNPERTGFVQSYGSDCVDASLLLLPAIGFLPIDDPRIASTVAAIERDLMPDGLVLRYRNADGLPPGEGVFLACSFWYADVLILQKRTAEAAALFARLVGLTNDVGLLSEEYDIRSRRMLGNFPQAFSHLSLIETAIALDDAQRRDA